MAAADRDRGVGGQRHRLAVHDGNFRSHRRSFLMLDTPVKTIIRR
jgi:hypothetical protein